MMNSPGSRTRDILGTYSFFVALTTILVGLRVYTRAVIVKSLGVDDWLVVVAWVLFLVFASFAITGTHHGNGQHIEYIQPPSEVPVGLKWWWACEPIYVLGNMALKSSIAVMLLRLTSTTIHRTIIWSTLAVIQLYSVFFFFLFVLQCRPSAYFWTRYTGGKGTCIDPMITVNATYGYSAVSCLGDWILSIIPVFIVWDLKMNLRTKVSVACILSMGAIASVTTIVRLPYIASLKNQQDFLWATADVAIWSCCETGLGIVACSAATLRPLFRVFLSKGRNFGSSSRAVTPAWPSEGAGYIRSGTEEFGLKRPGVTTYVESGSRNDEESGRPRRENSRGKSGSERDLTTKGNEWEDKGDDTSMEGDNTWPYGIRKTTVSHRVVE